MYPRYEQCKKDEDHWYKEYMKAKDGKYKNECKAKWEKQKNKWYVSSWKSSSNGRDWHKYSKDEYKE